jgi:hypothetical protein
MSRRQSQLMRFAVASVLLLLFAGCVSPFESELGPSTVTFTAGDFDTHSGYLLKFEGTGLAHGSVRIDSSIASAPDDELCIGDIGETKTIHFEAAIYQGVNAEGVAFNQNIAPPSSIDRRLGGLIEDSYFIGSINAPDSFELEVSAEGPIEIIPAKWACIENLNQLEGTSITAGATTVGQELSWSIEGEGFASISLAGNDYDAIAEPGSHVMQTAGQAGWSGSNYSTTFKDGASLEVKQIATNGGRPVMIFATYDISTGDAWDLWS